MIIINTASEAQGIVERYKALALKYGALVSVGDYGTCLKVSAPKLNSCILLVGRKNDKWSAIDKHGLVDYLESYLMTKLIDIYAEGFTESHEAGLKQVWEDGVLNGKLMSENGVELQIIETPDTNATPIETSEPKVK